MKNKRIAVRQYGNVILLIVLAFLITVINPGFFTLGNIENIFLRISVNGIIAVGMTFVLITSEIDMSVGSVLAFAGVVGTSIAHDGQSVTLAVLAGLGAGLLLGAVNGFLVGYAKIPSFIATLGMLSAARGFTNLYTNGRPIIQLSKRFLAIGQADFIGVPIPIWLFMMVVAVAYLLLRFTVFGRFVYATGSNEETSISSGINTSAIKLLAYSITGFCCGLAGLVLAARTNAGAANAGTGYELDVIAAVIIGGTSLSGGKGTIWGTVVGVLILGIIQNGLDVMNVSTYIQQIIKGAIIVGAVWLDKMNVNQKG